MPDFDDGIAETAVSKPGVIDTDVLVVGSGPAGASAALFLSTLGIANILITKYRWTANTPRAHITNQRTMEIFRDVGIEQQVIAEATPHELMGDTVFCTSIVGEELGRIRTFGTHPTRHAEFELASPSFNCDIPQTYLEPILVKNAAARGSQIRFSTEYVSHVQDADGVTVDEVDRGGVGRCGHKTLWRQRRFELLRSVGPWCRQAINLKILEPHVLLPCFSQYFQRNDILHGRVGEQAQLLEVFRLAQAHAHAQQPHRPGAPQVASFHQFFIQRQLWRAAHTFHRGLRKVREA